MKKLEIKNEDLLKHFSTSDIILYMKINEIIDHLVSQTKQDEGGEEE